MKPPPTESFIDKLERVWDQTQKVLGVLRRADDLAKELAPSDSQQPQPDQEPADNEREDSEP